MKALALNVLSMLSSHDVTFFIPPYQRNYEWTTEQCEIFLNDVKTTCQLNAEGKNTEHFFGTIIYFKAKTAYGQPDKLVLIDGQQRITTTMLFLVALRDILGTERGGKFIDSKFLKNNSVDGDEEHKVKLKQVETDWGAYKKLILAEKLSDDEKKSAVYRNYKYFLTKLSADNRGSVNLTDFIENGLEKFSVVTIELEPDKNKWENPQEIFESMNSLGKPLSLADLVRNYLLLGMDPETQNELYSRYWTPIEKAIPGRLSDFIRDYMQYRECQSFLKATERNYKELYSLFKKIFISADAKSLLEDLSLCSKIYSWLLPGGTCGNKEIDRLLEDLGRLNVTTAYSFFLAVLCAWQRGEFNDREVVDIFDAFRIYTVRRRILGLNAAENKSFPLLTKYILDLRTVSDKKERMFEILSDRESNLRLPNDIELSRYLETMNFYNFAHNKFIFSLIEESLSGSLPEVEDKNLQIERIMPHTLNETWIRELGEDYNSVREELENTIGNLTLIHNKTELNNRTFAEKKKFYTERDDLLIAQSWIVDQDVWNEDAIRRRTALVTEYLLKTVLPIPDRMRTTNNFSQNQKFHFSFKDLDLIGEEIRFRDDPTYRAIVVSPSEVEFEGKKWRLSPLTREILSRLGKVSPSGSYQGSRWWVFNGYVLYDLAIGMADGESD